jgi:hypothetical protein
MIKVVAKSYPYLLNGHVCLAYNPNHEEQGVSPYAFINVKIAGEATLFATKEEAEAAVAIRDEWYADKWNAGHIEYVEV